MVQTVLGRCSLDTTRMERHDSCDQRLSYWRPTVKNRRVFECHVSWANLKLNSKKRRNKNPSEIRKTSIRKNQENIIVNPTQEGTTQRNYKPGECSVCSKVSTRRQVMRRKKKREEDSTKMIFTTLL